MKNVDQVEAQGKVLSTTEVACRRKPRKSWSSRLWVLRSLSCKTTLPKEIHQKVSNAILRVMLGDDGNHWSKPSGRRGLNSSKRNLHTKNMKTTKISIQKQPKNSTAKQMSEMLLTRK